MTKIIKYAQTVNPQINPNTPAHENWSNIGNAVGNSSKVATSRYTKTKYLKSKATKNKKAVYDYKYNYPEKLTAHDFRLNIPNNAYIQNITFEVKMKTNKSGESVFPSVGFYLRDKRANVRNVKPGKTGWHEGVYWIFSNKKLSKTSKVETYKMSESVFHKGGYSVSDLNNAYCGIDLNFKGKIEPQTISLEWVRVIVNYITPSYSLTHNGVNTSKQHPREIISGEEFTVKYTLKQTTKANGGVQKFRLNVPFGTELIKAVPSSGTSFDKGNNIWTCNCNGVKTHTLTLTFIDYTVDEQNLSLNGVVSKPFYYQTFLGKISTYGDIRVYLKNEAHKLHDTYIGFKGRFKTTDYVLCLRFKSDPDAHVLGFDFNPDLSSEGVSVNQINAELGVVTFNVPPNTEVDIGGVFCVRPLVAKPQHMGVETCDATFEDVILVYVKPSYDYHFGTKTNNTDTDINNLFKPDEIIFANHRISSKITTGAFVLPCKSKDGDAVMVQNKPSVHMYKWEQVDYMGCVQLEQTHFDPESTYEDTLLNSNYKNNRYSGKKLAINEDITLNVRLRPHQVTTVQGLIGMDKPIPINANHKCFEGDALNHRGWAEIFKIKTKYTNPHWYKCEVGVKYLTHNLNTRFKIDKGVKSFNYNIDGLLGQVVRTGDRIGENQESDFFLVDTDGTYLYNTDDTLIKDYLDDNNTPVVYNGDDSIISEIEALGYVVVKPPVIDTNIQIIYDVIVDNARRNQFSLDEGQHLKIRTRKPLTNISYVKLDWLSSKLIENKENAVSRIVRLVDSITNNAVFEYEYSDFDFSEYEADNGFVSCHVSGRRLNKGDYDEVINQDIDIYVDVEGGVTSDDDEIDDFTDDDTIPFYGSSLHFKLNNHSLIVEDDGFNGKELPSTVVDLEGDSQYYWEFECVNNNTDGTDSDILTCINLNVQESILDTNLSDKYSSMYISPFPVSNKNILFTRTGEEGVIYYLEDNKEEFSYLIEPYYQYHNGVDLRTSSGISVFNLNYGYKTVYLENGLVSLGINRLNGQLYLRKYDASSKEYITTHVFQLSNYDDVNINSISDDKIELQASNTLISMYRGHPYVVLKHRGEDISILSNFKQVYGQSVGDDVSEYPIFFDLLNSSNLLPECVGSVMQLDDDCVVVSEEETNLEVPNIKLVVPENILEDENVDFNVTGISSGTVHYLINGDEIGSANYPNPFSHVFEESGAYEITAVYAGDETHSYAVTPTQTIEVKQVKVNNSGSGGGSNPPSLTGKYKLSMVSPSKFTYCDGQKVIFKLTKGGKPVKDKTVEMVDFKVINTAITDKNGVVSFRNNRSTNNVGKYRLGARFHEGGKVITSVWQDVVVDKASAKWHLNHYANKKGSTFSVNLRDKNNQDKKIPNQKVTIYINGKAFTKKTNSNGSVAVKIKNKGNYIYKCSFAGNKNFKKVTSNFREKVIN